MINHTSIATFCPAALPGYVDAIAAGKTEIEAAGIDQPLAWSHFISQLAHESGGLTFTREDTGWAGETMRRLWPRRFALGALDPRIIAAKGDPEKLANLAYSGRADLGNEGGNDGWLYRGAGLIQLTGRANYAACGEAIGVDLEGRPELIEDPAVALKAALWFWTRNDLGRFAEHNYGRTVGNGVNRGNPFSPLDPVGYKDRQQWFKRAWAIWGQGALPTDDVLYLGAYGPKVERLQASLKALGYPVGTTDGVLGPAMARAIAGFKLDQARAGVITDPAEEVGRLTLAALETAAPAPLSPDRTQATVASLAAAGSIEVAAGRRGRAAGQAALYTGGTLVADQLGALDWVQSILAGVSGLQGTLVPAIAAVQWGVRNFLPVALILGGAWAWQAFGGVIMARLEAHRTGANLGR
jgi:putative chitinase